ncbi:MAG TPA: 6-phosphogluconolactonase [Candidatus Binatia bacterium]|jgi:6-phosphogluconolactonase
MAASASSAQAGAPGVVTVADPDALAEAACHLVLECEHAALARSGVFRIALSGGSTPRRLYERLARSSAAQFARWQVFFGDERWVAADHPDSNARMAHEALLDHVPIQQRNVFAIDTSSGSPEKAATLYSITLRRHVPPGARGLPSLDLVLLGLGPDGHTASLFPGSAALAAPPESLCVANWAPGLRTWRVTLTAGVINAARSVAFLVAGPDKAAPLAEVLSGGATELPAALVHPAGGKLTWLVDSAAAARLGAQAP